MLACFFAWLLARLLASVSLVGSDSPSPGCYSLTTNANISVRPLIDRRPKDEPPRVPSHRRPRPTHPPASSCRTARLLRPSAAIKHRTDAKLHRTVGLETASGIHDRRTAGRLPRLCTGLPSGPIPRRTIPKLRSTTTPTLSRAIWTTILRTPGSIRSASATGKHRCCRAAGTTGLSRERRVRSFVDGWSGVVDGDGYWRHSVLIG